MPSKYSTVIPKDIKGVLHKKSHSTDKVVKSDFVVAMETPVSKSMLPVYMEGRKTMSFVSMNDIVLE